MNAHEDIATTARSVADRLGAAVVAVGQDGRGTGLVIAPGKVLTNAHNLRDRTTSVTFADGRTAQGSVVGSDHDGDLVVLDVDTGLVAPAAWADRAPSAGDMVFALSRGGHRQRISYGMVSSVELAFQGPRGRTIQGGIEHSAPLARGSSGGPLVDAAGLVIGLNTHRIGHGFYVARTIDAALRATIDEMAAGKSVRRVHLGVALAPPAVAAKLRRSVGLPERDGLLVRAVEPDSPASRAGLVEGDLLVAVGDSSLDSIDGLHAALSAAGDSIVVTIVRGVEERVVTISLADDADDADEAGDA